LSFLKKFVKTFLIISVLGFGVLFFLRNSLPDQTDILEAVYQAPVQKETTLTPFSVTREGFNAEITPLYSYELSGLVVSQNNSNV